MTFKRTFLILLAASGVVAGDAAALGAGGPMMPMSMGPMSTVRHAAFVGFYDGHKDTYLSLDASSKTEAAADHINYAPDLALVSLKTPEIYFVTGPSASGQVAVLGSQPGEPDYSPIWREVHVSFASGHSPVLLTSDNQINALAKKGMVKEQETSVRLNCPVIKVG